jgi:hypothetical protein
MRERKKGLTRKEKDSNHERDTKAKKRETIT